MSLSLARLVAPAEMAVALAGAAHAQAPAPSVTFTLPAASSDTARRAEVMTQAVVVTNDEGDRKFTVYLVGLSYHKVGDTLEFHAHAEYGEIGVGSDSDVGLGARFDWKAWEKQTVGGPVVGTGL